MNQSPRISTRRNPVGLASASFIRIMRLELGWHSYKMHGCTQLKVTHLRKMTLVTAVKISCLGRHLRKFHAVLCRKFALLTDDDFEFVKVLQKRISISQLSSRTEFSYQVIKKWVVRECCMYV